MCFLSVTVVKMLATEWALILTLFRNYYGAAVCDKKKIEDEAIPDECGNTYVEADAKRKIRLTASSRFYKCLALDFTCTLFPELKFICFEKYASEMLGVCLQYEKGMLEWIDDTPELIHPFFNYRVNWGQDVKIVDRVLRLNKNRGFIDGPLRRMNTDAKQFDVIPLNDKVPLKIKIRYV